MGGIGSGTTTARPWGASSCCPSGAGTVSGPAGGAAVPFPLLVAGAPETSGFWMSVTFVGGLCLGRLHVVHDDCDIDVVATLDPSCVAPPHVVGAFLPR